jgi:hypothetical protein
MHTQVSLNDEPEKWPFRRALKEKAGYTDDQIAELEHTAEGLDLVELAMEVEEKFGIEIADEEFLNLEAKDPFDGLQS